MSYYLQFSVFFFKKSPLPLLCILIADQQDTHQSQKHRSLIFVCFPFQDPFLDIPARGSTDSTTILNLISIALFSLLKANTLPIYRVNNFPLH